MRIILLGSSDDSYKSLEENTKKAVKELGIASTIEKIENFTTVYGNGVFNTIGIIIDGKIKAIGKVSTIEEIKNYILEGE